MASFGKLTEYFGLRKSRMELCCGRRSRRSGSCCCSITECSPQRLYMKKPQLRPQIQAVLAAGIEKAKRFMAVTRKQTKGSSCRI